MFIRLLTGGWGGVGDCLQQKDNDCVTVAVVTSGCICMVTPCLKNTKTEISVYTKYNDSKKLY